MRTPAAVAAVAALVCLSTACAGEEPAPTSTASAEAPAQTPEQTAAQTPEQTPEQTSASSSGTSSSQAPAAGAGASVLTGVVGEEGDPEAYTITLLDGSGEPVTSLPAGDYQVRVTDPSRTHNFHLTGPGVDETTSVRETTEVTWDVTLRPGEYTFVCDPHPSMVGSVTVT
ncbi:plastocyanin/azurin family copper-binding protein [Quadrisphaera sp. DSM 44207]|uniref:cupredoxin domain-containing protein n=1 Tax=Quadrisphaera sp. DSM 44207 TaxID=1881057 RepID=UPI0008923301|nr:plastocyanin/azurin family copper-binding protein [Quadrisphaera sp. DSM 44207]SDQ05182.1 Copper binding protein, plastocyanin/azurin family [Quadrisphaera sp. DSM 44207]